MELPDLLKVAVERKASDLHIKVGSPPVLRIDDKLVPLMEMPRLGQDAVVTMAASVMNAKQREKFKERCEIDLAYSVPGWGGSGPTCSSSGGRWGLCCASSPSRSRPLGS
jgi:twitching motility protein PilT